jgi:hypothetical protein
LPLIYAEFVVVIFLCLSGHSLVPPLLVSGNRGVCELGRRGVIIMHVQEKLVFATLTRRRSWWHCSGMLIIVDGISSFSRPDDLALCNRSEKYLDAFIKTLERLVPESFQVDTYIREALQEFQENSQKEVRKHTQGDIADGSTPGQ